MLTVGGWFDAENLFGPLLTYSTIEQQPGGVERHRDGAVVARRLGARRRRALGNLEFGSKTAEYYREEIEFAFFAHHLKDAATEAVAEASMFETGTNVWRRYDAWPPRGARSEPSTSPRDTGLGPSRLAGARPSTSTSATPPSPCPSSATPPWACASTT